MAKFDWLRFCQQYKIPYETKAKNVSRGNIGIRCPFCGGSDPSSHMGLSTDVKSPVWGCLRDTRHRGRNPVWLVMRLLACTADQAKQIVTGGQSSYGDEMAAEVSKITAIPASGVKSARFLQPQRTVIETWERRKTTDERRDSLYFSSEIKHIDGRGYSGGFLDYLVNRGFPDPYVPVETAGLRYAVTGKFAYRLIFPIYYGGRLVTYTGRDITGKSEIRYKTLPDDDAAVSIKQMLYMEDRIEQGGEILFLTEGPFDALKMNCYLQPDCLATCFFGMPEPAQIIKVLLYAPRWRYLVVLLDPEASMQRLALWYSLSTTTVKPLKMRLPQGAEDPGALSPSQVRAMARNVLPH